MSFEIVDYSEKSIAVFGDVLKYQNEFLDLKGMLNEKLRYKGAVATGFIFTKFKRPQVQDLVRKLKMLESNVNPDEEKGEVSSSSTPTTTSRIVQKTDDNVVLSREQFMNLVSTLNRLEQDVAFLKKQVLSHSSVSSIEKMVEKNEKNEKKTVIKVPAEKETKRVVKKEESDDEKSGNDDYSNDFDDDYNEEEDVPQSQGPSLLKLKKPEIKEEPKEKKGPSLLRKK